MIHAENYEKLSTFVKVTAKTLSVLFSDTVYDCMHVSILYLMSCMQCIRPCTCRPMYYVGLSAYLCITYACIFSPLCRFVDMYRHPCKGAQTTMSLTHSFLILQRFVCSIKLFSQSVSLADVGTGHTSQGTTGQRTRRYHNAPAADYATHRNWWRQWAWKQSSNPWTQESMDLWMRYTFRPRM